MFVLLSSQLLFMVRANVPRFQANDVMKAADKDKTWHGRKALAGAAMAEFVRNDMLSQTYNWYKNGEPHVPPADARNRVLLQVLDDIWLNKEDEQDALGDYLVANEDIRPESKKPASNLRRPTTAKSTSKGFLTRFVANKAARKEAKLIIRHVFGGKSTSMKPV
jgi:hypothetical protein